MVASSGQSNNPRPNESPLGHACAKSRVSPVMARKVQIQAGLASDAPSGEINRDPTKGLLQMDFKGYMTGHFGVV